MKDGETPREQKLENLDSEEVRGFRNRNMTAEIDGTCVELIKCFESAIEQLEEIRSGDIDQEGNLMYLLHDWSIHGDFNESLQNMWNKVEELKEEETQ